MIRRILKQMTWEDVREIVRVADSLLTEEKFDYEDEESYYLDVLRRLRKMEHVPPPISERFPEVLRAAEESVGCRLSASRRTENGLVRMFVSYILRHEGYSYAEIGSVLKRDHSTVIHMERKMDDMISLCYAYRREIDMFREFEELLAHPRQCSQPSSQTTSASALAESPAK